MAAGYDCDVTRPAASASEATRWTYLAYLAAVKSNDGAAISLGRLDAFLDVVHRTRPSIRRASIRG